MADNVLYYGDNLDVMRRHIKDETVDLVYLDPPFNSNRNYNVLFSEQNGSRAASQIRAFEDTWTWNQEGESVFAELVTAGGKVSDCLQAFRTFLGECDMLAYLVMMAPRLVELRRVLKPTGSIYLHCDPTTSHYLKMLMDAVFGAGSFRNEIVWSYETGGIPRYDFSRKHDVIFRYTKSDKWTFNANEVLEPRSDEVLRRIATGNPSATRSTGQYRHPSDVFKIPSINAMAKERLGYPTQKPEALLERIVKASSNPGDVVLDPFGGCGTTISVAQKLGRPWIGIDITHLAITLIKQRLKDSYGDAATFEVIGEPVSVPDAERLAESDPYQFQWWALGLVGARPVDQKKGADKGIDGRIIFQGDKPGIFESVILSVKAGHIGASHVRDLKGVLDREKAAMGVLISMQEPTAPMKTEAVTAGFYESVTWGRKYPKMQLLTVAELLAGRRIDYPPSRQTNVTFKKARKVKSEEGKTGLLPFDEKE